MITPSFGLTATERVLPNLALDFTTASLDPRVTFTRADNTATVTNSSGVIVGINANLPRFDFNPTTLVCNGLLIEEARTNLLLNSLINGTSLTTQIVTTSAVSTTLSFYGTGQIVLSGTSSATVVGAGAYPSRTKLTFTPTVGALTLTVSGTVQFAQLETGTFATSFIPTAGSQVTRNSDLAVMTGTNFSNWFNASEGTVVVQAYPYSDSSASLFPIFASFNDGTASNRLSISFRTVDDKAQTSMFTLGVLQVNLISTPIISYTTPNKISFAYKNNNFAAALNGNTPATTLSGTVPTLNNLTFNPSALYNSALNGYIQKFNYYPQRLTNSEVQAFSK